MLKKITCSILFFCLINTCFGQTTTSSKATQSQTSTKAEKKTNKPTGPVGFGSLKIGMSREQVEALKASDGIYLTDSMIPYTSERYVPVEGVDEFRTYLQTPLDSKPLKSVLSFEAGKLSSIHLSLDDEGFMLEKITSQISEKYGAGVVDNDRKEEQCIYKNGSNFKITKGTIYTTWKEQFAKNDQIETRTTDWLYDRCPDSLRYGSVGASRLTSITIKKQSKPTSEKSKNLF